MRKFQFLMAVIFTAGLVFTTFFVQSASAGALGNGSAATDTLQIGEIKSIGSKQVTIETRFEKSPKTYTLHLLPECYVMTAKRGKFMKFKELKKGDLIAAYGWQKGGKWNARRIDVLDTNDYLIKRLTADAKAGSYYKHER